MNSRLQAVISSYRFLKRPKLYEANFVRFRYYWKMMDCKELQPPATVRGMQVLDREAFHKRVQIPCLRVQGKYANRVLPLLKEKQLKMQKLKPVRAAKSEDLVEQNDSDKNLLNVLKEILLHPAAVTNWEALPIEKLQQYEVSPTDFYFTEIELSYDNWRADEILDFVLSNEIESVTSFSRIGHIIHLNLRDHLLPYKKLIAQVFADKLNGIRTVVNKTSNIDSTYRNFELELLHGEPEYKVETKENGIIFEFDFSLVYWNPRLSTEHERIVKMLKPNDVLYDVFAGVGPFSVPAAKKHCHVLANDLNPESYRWLVHNMKRNKCANYAKLFNKDGRAFILEDLKNDMLQRFRNDNHSKPTYQMHITMNLPAMATEFLSAFSGLFNQVDLNTLNLEKIDKWPIVHVYTFAKGDDTKSLALALVERNLGHSLGTNLETISFVRNVAPNKDMYRVSFHLTRKILFNVQEEELKKQILKRVSNENLDIETNAKVQCS